MFLTKEEEAVLSGEAGETKRKAMEILVAVGKIYRADKLIPVSSVQVSGVSYKTIGDAGLGFIKSWASSGARAVVPSYLNPAGMDLRDWKKMGFPESFAEKQLEIIRVYTSMGITPTCTCAPYQIGVRPGLGEHIAWAESNTVVFANSVLGARTNRESAVSALASALIGKTANFGLHLDGHRKASVVVSVEAPMKKFSDYGALGLLVGEKAKGGVPAFKGLPKTTTEDNLKSLGAAMAASGSVGLFYAEGLTPEFVLADSPEQITVTQEEIDGKREQMRTEQGQVGLVAIGCPHASLDEIKRVSEVVAGRKLEVRLWVCTSRENKEKAAELGYNKVIEDAGGLVVADTCMVVAPIESIGVKSTGVNSGKAAKYLPGFCAQKILFDDLERLLE